MMNDIQTLAQIRQDEMRDLVAKHQMLLKVIDAEKAEHARFMLAYRMRSMLNRFAPALAPRLGF